MNDDLGKRKRRSDLIARLCMRGSNDLVAALYRRLLADQQLPTPDEAQYAPTWEDVVDRAAVENLVSSKDRDMLLWGTAVSAAGQVRW